MFTLLYVEFACLVLPMVVILLLAGWKLLKWLWD
jgi:hypothetical protein